MRFLRRLLQSLKYQLSVFSWNVRNFQWDKNSLSKRDHAIRAFNDPHPRVLASLPTEFETAEECLSIEQERNRV